MTSPKIALETIDWLNQLETKDAEKTFCGCCGSGWWYHQMAADRPCADEKSLLQFVDRLFEVMPKNAWIESFNCHPRIGDMNSLRMKFAGNEKWSAGEQSGVDNANEETLVALAEGNQTYEKQFGYPFIVCATGKTAAEMLALLQARLTNSPEIEFPIACGEQKKITLLRLEKLQPEKDLS